MPCGDGGCCDTAKIENADEKPDLNQIREKYPNLYRTPRPEITVEPLTQADVVEAGGTAVPIKNENGDVMGYTYERTETGPLPTTTLAGSSVAELYAMPPTRVRYNTPPMMRYPSDRDDLALFACDFFDHCQEISREKNLRYAGAEDPFKNFRLGGQYGIAIRMTDKVSRLLTLTEPGCQVDGADESIEDTCRDLANYAMLLCAMRSNERS